MIHSMSKTNWFELDLEYAPIEDLNSLNIKDHYVYDLSLEVYITLAEYKEKIKILNNISEILPLVLPFYNKILDVYMYDNKMYKQLVDDNYNKLVIPDKFLITGDKYDDGIIPHTGYRIGYYANQISKYTSKQHLNYPNHK